MTAKDDLLVNFLRSRAEMGGQTGFNCSYQLKLCVATKTS